MTMPVPGLELPMSEKVDHGRRQLLTAATTLTGAVGVGFAAVPFLAIVTLSRALRGRIEQHPTIARWTLPIWLYVSVTGVLVYVMLYHHQRLFG